MTMDGMVADEQLLGDLGVRQAVGDEPEDFELAAGQPAVVAPARRWPGDIARLRQRIEQPTRARYLELGLQLGEQFDRAARFHGGLVDAVECGERARQLDA